jgi:hypothetical protein
LDVADPFHESLRLQAETGRQLLDFIRAELETCRTFASLAATEFQIGDQEAAERCIEE